MNTGYNGRDAVVLVTPSRLIHAAVGGRNAMPKSYPKPIPYFSPAAVSDFWSRVPVEMYDTDKCWLWSGTVGKTNGYGRWRTFYAHRVAYTLTRGPIPDGLTIDHVCRHRLCMNPTHMEAVT